MRGQHQRGGARTTGRFGGTGADTDAGSEGSTGPDTGAGGMLGGERTGKTARRAGRNTRLAASVALGLTAALVSGCGEQSAAGPRTVRGEAAPAPGDDSRQGGRGKQSASPSASSPSRGSDAKESDAPTTSPGGKEHGSSASGGGAKPDSPEAPGVGSCGTSSLAISSSGGTGDGTLVVDLRNTGSATCTLKGYPGVDLRMDEGSLSADRGNLDAPTVSLAPGETTYFVLRYPPNDTGGSGVNVSSLVVTPPNETRSQTVPVSINLPVTDGSSSSSITVDPVGAGG